MFYMVTIDMVALVQDRLDILNASLSNNESSPKKISGQPLGQATVLIIDDEEYVADVIQEILEQGQYQRLIATDPVIGVKIYEEQWRTIDLVILDYSMPKMNGKEVMIALRNINPNVKVIISTGYTEEDIINLMGNLKPTSFIQKPYTANILLSMVSNMLERK